MPPLPDDQRKANRQSARVSISQGAHKVGQAVLGTSQSVKKKKKKGQFPLSSIVLENWFCNHKAALQRSPMQLKNILVNGDTAPDFLSTWGRTENKMFICE